MEVTLRWAGPAHNKRGSAFGRLRRPSSQPANYLRGLGAEVFSGAEAEPGIWQVWAGSEPPER